MWNYDNLTNKELDRIRESIFGDTLKSIKEIGRESVIEELRQYDTFSLIKERHPRISRRYGIYRNRKQEREFKDVYRYVLWMTSNIGEHISLQEFMGMKGK